MNFYFASWRLLGLEILQFFHIRPQAGEYRASRPISCTQALDWPVSIAVGDRARILAVVCFWIFWRIFLGVGMVEWSGVERGWAHVA